MGKMTSWCKQVPGLEVVLLDGGETLQFAQVDVEATSPREALLDGLVASRVREDEHAAAAAAARAEVLAAAVKGTLRTLRRRRSACSTWRSSARRACVRGDVRRPS